MGDYWVSSGNSLPTFRDNLAVRSSRVKNPRRKLICKIELWKTLKLPDKFACHRLKNTDLDDSHASERWLIDIVSN